MRWDAASGKVVHTRTGHDGVTPVAVSPTGKPLASVGNRDVPPTVKPWDAATGATARILPGHLDRPLSAAYRADRQVLATAGADGSMRLWETAGGKLVTSLALRTPRGTVSRVVLHPAGDRVATVDGNGTVTVVELPAPSPAATE